jgi:EmrB/QacA subfamily drug resistance transporter
MAQNYPHFRTIGLIIGAAMFMEQLDGTVLTTALPAMARDMGVSAPAMSIALTSYLISLAIFIPMSGRAADRFGARNIFRAAMMVFAAGSLACALAPNLALLVLARFAQGLGGAMMMPVGRLVLLRSVEKRHLVSAMSWVLVPAMLGPILGPPVGGLIVTYFNWRWIFYINLPVAAIGVALVSLFIPAVPGDPPRPADPFGMLSSSLSLASLLFGFELASHPGEGGRAVTLLIIGAAAGFLYLRHARRIRHPILDFRHMRDPAYGTSVIAGSLTRITQGAQPFLLALLLQLGFGLSAAQSGLTVLATALGTVAMKALTPRVLRRFGFRDSLTVCGIGASLGYMSCALFRPGWPFPLIFLLLMLAGFFMSFQFSAYNTIAYDKIAADDISSATSLYTTLQQLMLSLGICTGALALEGAMWVRGHAAPQFPDFSVAFIAVTAISLTATLWNMRFALDAGTEISGHTPRTWSLRQALKELRGITP